MNFLKYDVGFVDVVNSYNIFVTNLVYTRLYFLAYFIIFIDLLCSVMCSILFDPGRCYCYWDSIKP
ncbi:hypothetical protein, partial [Methanobrevibacter sp.]|uniref:hypothetical protein n=1 Tax=Methanobrevibacter sp. TaxID=66852 RepID=UPI0025DCAA5B